MPRLEDVKPLKRVKGRLLHEIARVERAASARRQPAVRPPLQGRQAALEQCLDGHPVPFPGANDELHCGLIAQQRIKVLAGRRRERLFGSAFGH